MSDAGEELPKMKRATLDLGHHIHKYKAGSREGSFRHAMVQVPRNVYDEQLILHGKENMPPDYVVVNGTCYVYGDLAEKYRSQYRAIQRYGPDRWRQDYIGVQAAATLGRIYTKSGDAEIYIAHPPGDIAMVVELEAAVMGEWVVEIKGRTLEFNVTYSEGWPEPEGGIYNRMLNQDGTGHSDPVLAQADKILVLDIGGGTISLISATKGKVDYILNHTEPIGFTNVVVDFIRGFKAKYPKEFGRDRRLEPDRVRAAIVTGVYHAAGKEGGFPCQDVVDAAVSGLLTAVDQIYTTEAGGPNPWDVIVKTGGGTAGLSAHIDGILNHGMVVASGELDDIHMANVRGGEKRRKMYQAIEAAKSQARMEKQARKR